MFFYLVHAYDCKLMFKRTTTLEDRLLCKMFLSILAPSSACG
jgi:hypothetical protein